VLARTFLVLLAVLVVAGCGGSSKKADEQKIRATVLTFLHSYAKGDAKKACSILTAQGQTSLFGAATPAACEKTVRKQTGRHSSVATRTRNQLLAARVTLVVFLDKTHAKAQIALPTSDAPPAPLGVVKVGDRWLISGPPKGG
jgi:ABC-type glycerol-3-phosphate transport system substrate-binding protein